jgi:hypothetical protein
MIELSDELTSNLSTNHGGHADATEVGEHASHTTHC